MKDAYNNKFSFEMKGGMVWERGKGGGTFIS